ncbi:MAG TPA: hypothetical protein VM901_03210 [Bdellovibrionota bacterium]|nr:hypothetical protein [Bdellovibrionota bacterium]
MKTPIITLTVLSLGLFAGCAHKKTRSTASLEQNNMITIPMGFITSQGADWDSAYIIDKNTKECYTQLSMHSVIRTDCKLIKNNPEYARQLREAGF